MEFNINQFVQELEYKLNIFDLNGATADCNLLFNFLLKSDQLLPAKKTEKVLQLLRGKRLFFVMQKIAGTLLLTNRATFKMRKLYAQALIDSGEYAAATCILKTLIADINLTAGSTEDAAGELAEAKGLTGRVYKQLYLNINSPASEQAKLFIANALDAYYEVYAADKTKTWHGINAVALMVRANKDGIQLIPPADPQIIAGEILTCIQHLYEAETADAWNYATAAEACLALNKPQDALKWLSGYARMPQCDAFELASTLRQLEEVWQLSLDTEAGKLLLPILRAELLKKQGSNITLPIEDIKKQQAAEPIIDEQYKPLIETNSAEVKLEKVFGNDSFQTYKWYMKGAARCLLVARIGTEISKGFGTGFLLKGKDLKEAWGDDWVLLTNAHVVSNFPEEKSLRPQDIVIIFEALDNGEEFRNMEIAWSSPSTALDATVLKFEADDQQRLNEMLKGIKVFPVSRHLPVVDNPPTQKIYIIGHPNGGTLQLSFQDNLLVDHDKISKIHYRTPTEGGSSGSPVFNQQWELIGLHHAGSKEMPCLNGKAGTYEANEGIWIQAIKKALL